VCVKISVFEPKKRHLPEVLLYFFNVKKFAVESHRLLIEAYSEAACRDWLRCFKSSDFDVEEHAGRPKLVENAELEALLDEKPRQTQKEWKLLDQPFPCV